MVPHLLGTAVAIHALATFLMVHSARQTQFGNLLFMVLELPHGQAMQVEKITVSIFLALAVVSALRPRLLTLLPVGAYVLLEAWSAFHQGGDRFSEWTPAAHALRWVTPFALALLAAPVLASRVPASIRRAGAGWMLRLAVATVFVIHGLECLWGYPRFADLIIGSARGVLDVRVSEALALQVMQVIGIVDLAVAAAIVVRPWRTVLVWAAFWGGITALSRVLALGPGAYFEVLLRASHVLAPLALIPLLHPGTARILPRLPGRFSPSRPPPDFSTMTPLPESMVARGTRDSRSTRSTPGSGSTRTRRALPLILLALLPALALPGAAPASAQETIRPLPASAKPQHLRILFEEKPATEAVVSWTTTVPGTHHVVHFDTEPRHGDTEAYARQTTRIVSGAWTLLPTESEMAAWYHHAPLTGLEPATTYYLTVETDGETLGEYHFITAPDDDREVALLVGGDSRVGEDRVHPGNMRRRMNARMRMLLETNPHVLALAHTADYTNRAYWSELYHWLNDHFEMTTTADGRLLPMLPSRGNHDLDVGFEEMFHWPGRATDFYYASQLNAGSVFIALNTEISRSGDQQDWLAATLERVRPANRWVGAFFHRPAYPSVRAFDSGEPQRRAWVPLFERYGLDLVAVGHDHALKRTVPILEGQANPRGIVYIGDGGLGVRPREVATDRWYINGGGISQSVHNVHLIEFGTDALHVRAFGMGGEVLDELLIPADRGLRLRQYDALLRRAADR
ncbi:MAG: metallophosphoesterase family protein [Gemmatimonadales bacterium]|nr:MAG: metallophosphoesterase family protein [Gemmatimonadales bacterium]